MILRRLPYTGRVSTYSSGIMLERVELPLPVMLRLAAIIADDIEASPLSPSEGGVGGEGEDDEEDEN